MSHPDQLVRQSSEWIAQIRHGDEGAFEQLYRAFAPGLIAFAAGYVANRAVAEELVQELFLNVWRKRTDLVIHSAVPTYLYTGLRNLSIDYLRRERRQVSWDPAIVGRVNDTTAPRDTLLLELLDLQDAVSRLPGRCRLIFTLSRQHDMTYDQIAEALGLSVKTVEVQMGRALRRLRAWLASSA